MNFTQKKFSFVRRSDPTTGRTELNEATHPEKREAGSRSRVVSLPGINVQTGWLGKHSSSELRRRPPIA